MLLLTCLWSLTMDQEKTETVPKALPLLTPLPLGRDSVDVTGEEQTERRSCWLNRIKDVFWTDCGRKAAPLERQIEKRKIEIGVYFRLTQ